MNKVRIMQRKPGVWVVDTYWEWPHCWKTCFFGNFDGACTFAYQLRKQLAWERAVIESIYPLEQKS